MSEKRHAEELPYWDTTTTVPSNQERIESLLRKFGADTVQIQMTRRGHEAVWSIRFTFNNKGYAFRYQPCETKWHEDDRIKSRTRGEQALCQMSARAYWEIKAILCAAEFDRDERVVPRSLFGYLELPGKSTSGLPMVASDFDVTNLGQRLLALPASTGSEFIEVDE